MTGDGKSPDYGEPKGAWKTDFLAVFLIAFAVVAVLTFLRRRLHLLCNGKH
jgi:hypothetical protein